MQSSFSGPPAIAAYIGAVAVIIGAYLGYLAGERQYGLDHEKWMVDLVIKIALNESTLAKNIVTDIVKSDVLKKDDADTLCKVFLNQKPCAPLAK